MKLQIDTSIKTITIDESIAFGELFDLLATMFPDMGWREYLLVPVNKIEVWTNPITVPYTPPYIPYNPIIPYVPSVPFTYPIITCGTDNSIINLDFKYESNTAPKM